MVMNSVPLGATAFTPPGAAPPAMRSNRSASLRNSDWITARSTRVLSIVRTPTVAVYWRNAFFALTRSSEYVCRLWSSKSSVTGPRCGGMVTSTPNAGSRPASTSQKRRFVLTPTPSSEGQVSSA